MNPGAGTVGALELGPPADPFHGRQSLPEGRHMDPAYPSSATVRRFRPFVRRRFSTMRPFLVDILTRKPCVFARRRRLGW